MRVPFLDLKIQNLEERRAILDSIEQVLNHGQIVLGPEIQQFEETIANYCGRKFAVSVGSGTDALYLALRAYDIGFGNEVITTSLSWIATANAIALTGAKPVFADINEDLNIDSNSVKKLINKNTKAILAVDYTGKVCCMNELTSIAKENNLILIEDGSQAFGATYFNKRCGSFGDISAISHNPMKVYAALGEAGSILCDDKKVYNRLISLRYNGTINKEICVEPSLNGRMDTIQAAILLHRLKRLDDLIKKRRTNAKLYDVELKGMVGLPIEKDYEKDVYYTYIIRCSHRDELKKFLEDKGIETKIQHSLLMSEQPAYKNRYKSDTIKAQKLVKEILCIPIHEKLKDEQIQYVIESIQEFYK